MERFSYEAESFTPRDERLEAATVAALSAPGGMQAAIFTLAPGGRIARHRATVPQILAVLAGSGHVSGGDGVFEPISTGEAVFWSSGEEHETVTDAGLTAIVLEGSELRPPSRRPR